MADSAGLSEIASLSRRRYAEILAGSGSAVPWWTAVVITASSERQAELYSEEIAGRRRRGGLPADTLFLSVPDPGGQRIGSGGATLNALRALAEASFLRAGAGVAGSVVGVAASVGHPLGGRRAPPSTVLAAGEALRLPPRADGLGGAEHGVRRVPHPLHIVGRATRVGRGHRLRRRRPDLRFQRPAVGSSRRVGRRHSSAHGGGQRARRLCHRWRGPDLRLPAEADGGRGARRGRTPGGRQGCRR